MWHLKFRYKDDAMALYGPDIWYMVQLLPLMMSRRPQFAISIVFLNNSIMHTDFIRWVILLNKGLQMWHETAQTQATVMATDFIWSTCPFQSRIIINSTNRNTVKTWNSVNEFWTIVLYIFVTYFHKITWMWQSINERVIR